MVVRILRRYIGPKTLALLVGALFGLLRSYSGSAQFSSQDLQQGSVLEHNDPVVLKPDKVVIKQKQAPIKIVKDAKGGAIPQQARNLLQDEIFKARDKVKRPAFVFQEAKNKVEEEESKPEEDVAAAKPKAPEAVDPPSDQEANEPAKGQLKAPAEKPSDKKVVVNPHPFHLVLSNPDLCKVDDLFLLVYVHTASDHYKRRAIIRQTWGNIAKFPNVRVMFVMGNTSSVPMMQSALRFEAETYKDILQEDFEDTYRNLTYKGIAALKWISNNCNNAKYILKTDDDVFVNMYTILNHLQSLYTGGYDSKLILCLVWWKMHALREGKWGIPESMYPDSLYPPYCSGMAYMFSIDVPKKLFDVSFYVKFFWVDDVYVSGMLPKAAGLNHTTMIKAYCGKNEMEDLFTHPTEWYKYAFTHIHDEDMFLRVWDRVTAIAKNNKIPAPSKVEPGLLADTYIPKDKVVKAKQNPDPKKPEAKQKG